MGRKQSPNSVRHIVSFRVNSEEYQQLERWSTASGKNLSAMLRDLFTQMRNPFEDDVDNN